MSTRPTKDAYFMMLARHVATRTTCLRRAVGCVLVNARGHILATGYNGVAAGQPHCNEAVVLMGSDGKADVAYPHACDAASAPSGVSLDACQAIHAEQNALLQCHDVWQIEACYVTTMPCVPCLKLLLSTSCARIVYGEPYLAHQHLVRKMWVTRAGRQLVHLKE